MGDLKGIEHQVGLDLSMDETMRQFGALTAEELAAERTVERAFIREGEIIYVSFEKRTIRKILRNGEWWFSTIDVVSALTDHPRSSEYWHELKERIIKTEGFVELADKIGRLPLPGTDGHLHATEV